MRLKLMLPVCLAISMSAYAIDVTDFRKNLEATIVVPQAIAPEAITLSDDGDKMTFIAKDSTDFQAAPPTTAWIVKKNNNNLWASPVKLPWGGMITSISFANHDQWLVASISKGTISGYVSILKNIFGDHEKIGDLLGFKHRIQIFNAKNPKELVMSLSPEDFGLVKPEMLKHARVSPNGKWLAFYTHGYEDQRGIYVYNFETKKTIHLGLTNDKHPTWSPDGSKILFHEQDGGNAFGSNSVDERSLIGYYDLDVRNNNELVAVRNLMDTNNETFYYFKHPSMYPGTDLVFFHGLQKKDGSKKLFVRRIGVDTKIFKISDLLNEEVEIKGTKHGNSSISASGLFFVGRKKGNATTEVRPIDKQSEFSPIITIADLKDIYSISDMDVQKINRFVLKNDN
ncbi:MAG: hypothetical protein WA160_04855 [Pseudobdellovibrio sp.]